MLTHRTRQVRRACDAVRVEPDTQAMTELGSSHVTISGVFQVTQMAGCLTTQAPATMCILLDRNATACASQWAEALLRKGQQLHSQGLKYLCKSRWDTINKASHLFPLLPAPCHPRPHMHAGPRRAPRPPARRRRGPSRRGRWSGRCWRRRSTCSAPPVRGCALYDQLRTAAGTSPLLLARREGTPTHWDDGERGHRLVDGGACHG